VARCVTEFAKGNHPSHPNYYNDDLILEECDLFRGGWTHSKINDSGEKEELIWELHPAATADNDNKVAIS